MEILKHCRIYPISSFCATTETYFKIPDDLVNQHLALRTRKLGHIHVVEHSFRLSKVKKKLITTNLDENSGLILLIDVISCWKQFARSLVNNGQSIAYLSSASLCQFDGLLNFLGQLIDSPDEALKRCIFTDSYSYSCLQQPLTGIIIDNLSYYQTPVAMREFSALQKMLKSLRSTFGCWTMTTSYGLEYYNGVEGGTSSLYTSSGTSFTRLPVSYIKDTDLVLMRDTEDTYHLVK